MRGIMTKLEIFIALAASGNKQTYVFFSGDLGQCMAIHHAKRCIGQCRSTPFISIEDAEVETINGNHIQNICHQFLLDTKHVAFSVGVDATIIVKAFQYSLRLGAIIGDMYPIHCIDVHEKSIEDINIILNIG